MFKCSSTIPKWIISIGLIGKIGIENYLQSQV